MTTELLTQLLLLFRQFSLDFQVSSAVIVSMFTAFIYAIKRFSEVFNWLMEPSLYSKN